MPRLVVKVTRIVTPGYQMVLWKARLIIEMEPRNKIQVIQYVSRVEGACPESKMHPFQGEAHHRAFHARSLWASLLASVIDGLVSTC